MPRTELPCSSSRGDQTQMPISPGITSITAPETPLLAGRPMVKANSPEKSYMPQEDISDRQDCTVPGLNTGSSVSGQTPALVDIQAPGFDVADSDGWLRFGGWRGVAGAAVRGFGDDLGL